MSMCVQSDKPSRMLFIYSSSTVAPCKNPPFNPTPVSQRVPQGMLSAFWQIQNKRHIVSANDTLFLWLLTSYLCAHLTLWMFIWAQASCLFTTVHRKWWICVFHCLPPLDSAVVTRNIPLTSLISALIFPPRSLSLQNNPTSRSQMIVQSNHLCACVACTAEHKPFVRMSGGDRWNKQIL